MAKPDIKALFEAGAHFGHKTSRWHPKMAPYIHSARGGIHIINLEKTVDLLEPALAFLEKTASEGKQIMLVGTKRQATKVVKEAAEATGMPYVSVRWFGGMLTNRQTILERVKYLKKQEERMESGELENRYNKLEVQRFAEEIEQLNYNFGGVKELKGTPGAIFVADVVGDELAVREANKLGVPVVGVVDTNANPTEIDYPIPANDDAIKSLQLISSYVVEAINKGVAAHKAKAKATKDKKKEK
jgi:small subunit ribosomal protein S2